MGHLGHSNPIDLYCIAGELLLTATIGDRDPIRYTITVGSFKVWHGMVWYGPLWGSRKQGIN